MTGTRSASASQLRLRWTLATAGGLTAGLAAGIDLPPLPGGWVEGWERRAGEVRGGALTRPRRTLG
jgi:hypothetical protein